jgi:hypothetical protein
VRKKDSPLAISCILSIADFGTVSLFNPSKRIFNRLSVSSTILWIGAWASVHLQFLEKERLRREEMRKGGTYRMRSLFDTT